MRTYRGERTEGHSSVGNLKETWRRLISSVVVAAVTAVIVDRFLRDSYAPVAGWLAGALLYVGATWRKIAGLNPEATRQHATQDDPGRAASHIALATASVASLGGVALLLMQSDGEGPVAAAWAVILSLGSVAASWLLVSTLYTLRYAALYYEPPVGGVTFAETEPPTYADFAYLSLGIAMTYQVADVTLSSPQLRRAVLRHSLLSYVLGAVVLAISINLVSSLSSGRGS